MERYLLSAAHFNWMVSGRAVGCKHQMIWAKCSNSARSSHNGNIHWLLFGLAQKLNSRFNVSIGIISLYPHRIRILERRRCSFCLTSDFDASPTLTMVAWQSIPMAIINCFIMFILLFLSKVGSVWKTTINEIRPFVSAEIYSRLQQREVREKNFMKTGDRHRQKGSK